MTTQKTPVVFLWHMHQPDYRDCVTGEYYFPWTYLHALKDYVDMVAHLEAHPSCKAVFNFVPILIEQLQDYEKQLAGYFAKGTPLTDPVLALLTNADKPAPSAPEYHALLEKCTRANRKRIIDRFVPYKNLVDLFDCWQQSDNEHCYFNEQFLTDIALWYHLGWLGETVRREDARVQQLQAKGQGYTEDDARLLLQIIGEQMTGLIGRYRALAERKQIEISTTPYAHPIVPLLLDLSSTREAMPNAVLPSTSSYPGGEARVNWHLEHGLKVFKEAFGFTPTGCWASEGALSEATLCLLNKAGFRWTATGDSVLFNSLKSDENHALARDIEQLPGKRHTPFTLPGAPISLFFRDDGLSDKIGFNYADWHADDAAGDFIHHLENIAATGQAKVISIVMDGENAWEYFPENAYYFLDTLYHRLENHPTLVTTTYSDFLNRTPPAKPVALSSLTAGSWVYGSFSTWIGDTDKNRAWDLLCQAKSDFDRVIAEQKLTSEEVELAELQLALCEGSDWFWWFGDYNPSDSVRDFDYLYRRHLENLYKLLKLEAPPQLSVPISQGSGDPANGGVMRQGHQDGH